MSYLSVAPGSYRIDVVDEVGRAYRAVLDNVQLVGEMAFLPYLIVLAAELLAWLVTGGGFFGRLLAGLIHAVVLLIFGTVFIVRWHRFVLLGESVSGGLIPSGWTPFVIAGIKLGIVLVAGWVALIVVAALPPHFLTNPRSMIGGIALALLALRLSLIFPAAAIERPLGLQAAWGWVEGNFWRLFACALACYLPFVVVQLVLGWIAAIFPSLLWIVFEALRLATAFVGSAVVAALLSHVYREIAATSAPATA
jgi:hypothetical protein